MQGFFQEPADSRWIAEIAKQTSHNIVRYREELDWKTNRLAKEARLNYNSLKSWEDGTNPPSLVALLKLTRVFGLISVEEILFGTPYLHELPYVAARGTQFMLELREDQEP
jgi:DNA-binding XRE family transcriptional regulator